MGPLARLLLGHCSPGRWSATGRPEIESTDHLEGIAPVPKRVRLDPGRPGKIIAVPKLLKSNICNAGPGAPYVPGRRVDEQILTGAVVPFGRGYLGLLCERVPGELMHLWCV